MILFIVSLFTALSFSGTPPGCDNLGKILQSYEQNLQKASIKSCTPELAGTLLKTLPAAPSAKNINFLKDRVCLDLVTIESELQQLNLELAVMSGIEKLKETVNQTQQEVKNLKNPDIQKSARGFAKSLNTAQSLELLLSSVTSKNKSFAEALKEFPESQRLNQNDLSNRIQELCAGKPKNNEDACNPKLFAPGLEAATEILGIIKEATPDLKSISKWQNQLKITRKNSQEGDEDYSFIQMQKELGGAFANIDSKDVLSKDQINAIQKLDEFTFNPKFGFVSDISILKDKKKNKISSDRFFLLMKDAQVRQQYEVQSKLSIVWQNLQDNITGLTDEQKSQCDNAKAIYTAALSCTKSLEGIKSKQQGETKARLESFLPSLMVSHNYVKALDEQSIICEDQIKTNEILDSKCFDRFNIDKADAQEKILHLNMLKEKIASENVRDMKFRNLALQKWTDQKCKYASTPMDMCETPGLLSKDVLMTASDAMKISIVFDSSPKEKSDALAKAKVVCEDENDKALTRVENELCQFFKDTTSDIITNKNDDDFEAPVAPAKENEKDKIKDAWIQGGANILKDVFSQAFPNQTNQAPYGVNPYPMTYNPFNFAGTQQMGISDTIMFNSRYYGSYGLYMPTPGYAPYTAFGPNSTLSNYKPMLAPSTKYFSY